LQIQIKNEERRGNEKTNMIDQWYGISHETRGLARGDVPDVEDVEYVDDVAAAAAGRSG
jgi:hypothetical protein